MYEPNLDLLCDITPDTILVDDVVKTYQTNYSQYLHSAASWTKLYATKQPWSIFNHKTITSDKHRKQVIYILWIGKCIANKISFLSQSFMDPWVINVMPNIIDQIGPDLKCCYYNIDYHKMYYMLHEEL